MLGEHKGVGMQCIASEPYLKYFAGKFTSVMMPDPIDMTDERTILIVDDDPIVIEVSRMMLNELGYRVLSATSGPEAVEVYKQKMDLIDLVICDMFMPGLSGGQTFKALKEVDDQVKMVIASGYSQDREVNDLLDCGCLDFILKPYDVGQLQRAISANIS